MSAGGQGLGVKFKGRNALSGVNLSLKPGTITVVVGGDGAGKTTLVRMLAGSLEPTTGTIHRPRPERIGYMSAGPGVYPDLTVKENLHFSGTAYRMERAELRDRIAELLEHMELERARDRLARNLSGGMRQKLALAAAVLHRPELLVLDEPTTGVDPVSRAELWRLVAHEAASGATVIVATSYIEEAERAGNVIVLDEGRVLMEGPPADIRHRYSGAIYEIPSRPPSGSAWRRGRKWRTWVSNGNGIPGGRAVTSDLEDAVLVAQLEAAHGVGAEAS